MFPGQREVGVDGAKGIGYRAHCAHVMVSCSVSEVSAFQGHRYMLVIMLLPS